MMGQRAFSTRDYAYAPRHQNCALIPTMGINGAQMIVGDLVHGLIELKMSQWSQQMGSGPPKTLGCELTMRSSSVEPDR